MRFPIKFVRQRLPEALWRLLPNVSDPKLILMDQTPADVYAGAVSAFNFHGIWKSTSLNRSPLLDKKLTDLAKSFHRPSILEAGISTGAGVVALYESLSGNVSTYYATDKFTHAQVVERDGLTCFFDMNGNGVLVAGSNLIYYQEVEGAPFFLRWLCKRKLRKFEISTDCQIVELVDRELLELSRTGDAVQLVGYDVMDAWPGPSVDLIKVANLFNRAYFSDDELFKGLKNLMEALNVGGYLFVAENRPDERLAVYRKQPAGLELVSTTTKTIDVFDLISSRLKD